MTRALTLLEYQSAWMMARPAPRRHRRPFVPGAERITDHFGPADGHADIEKKEFVAASAQRSWALNRFKIFSLLCDTLVTFDCIWFMSIGLCRHTYFGVQGKPRPQALYPGRLMM